MAVSLLERYVFIIASWGPCYPQEDVAHSTLCVLHHLLLSWKAGKLPVLGRGRCSSSACSYLGRDAALSRFLKAQQGLTLELLPLTYPRYAPQLSGCLGNF